MDIGPVQVQRRNKKCLDDSVSTKNIKRDLLAQRSQCDTAVPRRFHQLQLRKPLDHACRRPLCHINFLRKANDASFTAGRFSTEHINRLDVILDGFRSHDRIILPTE